MTRWDALKCIAITLLVAFAFECGFGIGRDSGEQATLKHQASILDRLAIDARHDGRMIGFREGRDSIFREIGERQVYGERMIAPQ